jgi:hypothetical protein
MFFKEAVWALRPVEPALSEAEWGPAFSPPAIDAHGSIALTFVIPSEAEGSAVLQARPGNVFPRKRSGLRGP